MKDLTLLLEELRAKGEALGDALAHEQELEDDRAAIKADAIVRIMKRDSLAATPAEKIVETDEEYFKHRARQRASIVARYRADAEYHAAIAAAVQASLVTPSMIELQSKISGLEKDLKQAKRDVDLREIALRRANGLLADRIRDVEQLTAKVRELTAGSGEEKTFTPIAFASDPRD